MDAPSPTLAERVGELHRRRAIAWILFAGMCLFLWFLHFYKNRVNFDRELWLDEASTFIVASYPLKRVLSLSIELHSQPPLYYVLLHFLALIKDSEVFLRSISWISCLGVVAFVMLDLNELTIVPRVVFSVLFILSDFTTYLSGELRPYALATFLTFVSSVLLVRLIRDPKNRRLLLVYAPTAVAMLYTLAFDAWVLAVHGMYASLVLLLRVRRVGFMEALRTWGPLVLTILIVALTYIPYYHFVTKFHAGEGHPDMVAGLHEAMKLETYDEILDRFVPLSFPYSYAMLALVLVGALGERSLTIVLWLLLFFGQSAFAHAVTYGRLSVALRYSTPAFPIALLGIAIGLHHLLRVRVRPSVSVAVVLTLWLLVRKERKAYQLERSTPKALSNWRKLRLNLMAVPGTKALFFKTGFYGQMLGYLTRHDPDFTFLTRGFEQPAPGRAPAGGDVMTPAYVETEIRNQAPTTRCFFYSIDRRNRKSTDPVYEKTFVPAMARYGYTERLHFETDQKVDMKHDYYDVHGFCRPR